MDKKWALLNCLPLWLCIAVFAVMYYQSFHPSLIPETIIVALFDLFIYYVMRTM